MNLQNSFPLTIRVEDFNLVAKKPRLIQQLRGLTIYSGSGMNHELNTLLNTVKTRPVNCKIITAHHHGEMVGWALLSKEVSYFSYSYSQKYDPTQGTLFQVFVNPAFRRKGIGSALVKMARKKVSSSTLCFCPWDENSNRFFGKFNHYKHIKL